MEFGAVDHRAPWISPFILYEPCPHHPSEVLQRSWTGSNALIQYRAVRLAASSSPSCRVHRHHLHNTRAFLTPGGLQLRSPSHCGRSQLTSTSHLSSERPPVIIHLTCRNSIHTWESPAVLLSFNDDSSIGHSPFPWPTFKAITALRVTLKPLQRAPEGFNETSLISPPTRRCRTGFVHSPVPA